MRRHGSHRAIVLVAAVVCLASIGLTAQPAARITEIEIVDLVPFEFSFVFENRGDRAIDRIRGTATLLDRSGTRVDGIQVPSFEAAPGERREIVVRGRWELQIRGIYLLEIALDLGDDALISGTLPFRILAIRLPLAPQPAAEGEGLYTVYQRPVNWGLERIDAPSAWALSHGRREVVVAVIDSGIDWTVPQLAESLWVNPGEIPGNGIDDDGNGYIDDIHGWDFRDGDNSSMVGSPLHWHGTFVAGLIAARPGDLPIVGVAPGVKIMDVRFLDSSNSFRTSDWPVFVEAIDYAVDNGADIINLSIYANQRPPSAFEDALRRAVGRGVIVVGITGNRGEAQVMYPGRFDTVHAVSATTRDDLLAPFSNHGPEVAFSAPGDGVTSITVGGRPSTRSGTSFAAPHVTGILALILSLVPELSPAEAVSVLQRTATDLGPRGPDDLYGYGLVNALEALRYLGGRGGG